MISKLIIFFILNINLLLGAARWEEYKHTIIPIQKTFEGWCSEEKANKMMDLIYETKPKICVEIGVFGGSSVYPTAAALKFCDGGLIYAIDPWLTVECLKGYDPQDPNYKWWQSINLEEVLRKFISKMKENHVYNYCVILRTTSKGAVKLFDDQSIDILHVDGNHSDLIALQDIVLYFPKVKPGGYIWFDDINWDTTAKAVKFLMDKCKDFDKMRSMESCLLFRKPM